MVDALTPAERSARMRSVKQRNTSLELVVRTGLHNRGLRYRLDNRTLPGSPDLVFPGRTAVVFVHGCFWHAHDCRLGRRPTSNAAFWEQKALANRERDSRKETELKALGWRVFVVWQCQLSDTVKRETTLSRLAAVLKGQCAAGSS